MQLWRFETADGANPTMEVLKAARKGDFDASAYASLFDRGELPETILSSMNEDELIGLAPSARARANDVWEGSKVYAFPIDELYSDIEDVAEVFLNEETADGYTEDREVAVCIDIPDDVYEAGVKRGSIVQCTGLYGSNRYPREEVELPEVVVSPETYVELLAKYGKTVSMDRFADLEPSDGYDY